MSTNELFSPTISGYIPFVAEYYWADKVHYGILVFPDIPHNRKLRS